ncbi:hypothetical protein CDV31_016346 [Fusarium ambrosium]|uniref:Uncharacterized protein n=1 Tax=Fusarium ambrosium TaxID=131363 RepID=A0A428SAN5_9HYPO|nr:hypothetical protein CDV31_016346 [Fusarium ambrosium]
MAPASTAPASTDPDTSAPDPAPGTPVSTDPDPPAPTARFNIEDAKNYIASIVNKAELKANEAVAASNAAEDAYWKHDAETVFDQAGKASTALSAVQEQQKLLHNYIKDSINKLDDDLVQAASKSMSSELTRAVEAAGDADKRKTMAQVMKDDPYWGQLDIPDAETKQQQALADAQEARNAADQAITNATRLRQRADVLAEKAYAIQEAARTKEGSEKDAEMQRFREMTIELPEALQNAKKAEQDAKEAEDLAVVRANDAGISSQDLQQKEQNPWGDILGSSENSIQPSSSDSISIPRRLVRGGAEGKIVCILPRGQLVVVAKHLQHFQAFILPSTLSMERKAFKDHGGLQLEYEDVESYDEDDVSDLHDLDPLLVAVQTAKSTKRTVLVILIAKRHGSDDRILLYNMSRLKAIFPASEVALYLNDVRAKQDQDPRALVLELGPKHVVRLELPRDKELHHDRLNEFANSHHGLLLSRTIQLAPGCRVNVPERRDRIEIQVLRKNSTDDTERPWETVMGGPSSKMYPICQRLYDGEAAAREAMTCCTMGKKTSLFEGCNQCAEPDSLYQACFSLRPSSACSNCILRGHRTSCTEVDVEHLRRRRRRAVQKRRRRVRGSARVDPPVRDGVLISEGAVFVDLTVSDVEASE